MKSKLNSKDNEIGTQDKESLSIENSKESEEVKSDLDIKTVRIYKPSKFTKKDLFELVFSFTNRSKSYVLYGQEVENDFLNVYVCNKYIFPKFILIQIT